MMKKLFVVILTIFCVAFGSLSHANSVVNPDKKACKHNVVNELRSFNGKTYKIGNQTFKLDRKGMKHILERHHPYFWNGTTKPTQTYFSCKMSVKEIIYAIESIMKKHRKVLLREGAGQYQIEGRYKGKLYVVGFNRGRIGQFYPKLE
ncbi:EndoU domain-containing protein [Xenorhabdus sp. XENO-10]|uniref:EndoU domain-containing protein n=1 Tax=Xenorhabdus yunnanensis TaxID=3025878 RepID=A0ABT5LKX7_9GAMM|nr:EndoU domain-containing protein [Xenorhabdus yunnanensis]MDC9591773.1 EndoU domain-containing protein [Xenorhabdus yunnanensis]